MMNFSHDVSLVVFGTLIGISVGAYIPWRKLFSALKSSGSNKNASSNGSADQDSFLLESARLIGQVCQIDAAINEQERDAFQEKFFLLFPTARNQEEDILFAFENENLRGRNLAEGIAQFYWDHSSRKDELQALLRLGIELSLVDGEKNAGEEHILEVIARTFGIHPKDHRKMEQEILEARRTQIRSRAQKKSNGSGRDSRVDATTETKGREERHRRSEETLRTLSHSKYYRVLGLTSDASKAEIKAAYRKLVKENHPDFARGKVKDGGKRFREIQIAYEALQKANLV